MNSLSKAVVILNYTITIYSRDNDTGYIPCSKLLLKGCKSGLSVFSLNIAKFNAVEFRIGADN